MVVTRQSSIGSTMSSQSSNDDSGRTKENSESHNLFYNKNNNSNTHPQVRWAQTCTEITVTKVPKQRRSTKDVRFCPSVKVFDIPSYRDFSNSVMIRTYYTMDELARCRPEEFRKYSSCCNGDCLRGLECWTIQRNRHSSSQKTNCQITQTAVFDEMKNDRMRRNREAHVAKVYSLLTRHAQEDAHHAALEDEYYVKKYVYKLPYTELSVPTDKPILASCKQCTCNKSDNPTLLLQLKKGNGGSKYPRLESRVPEGRRGMMLSKSLSFKRPKAFRAEKLYLEQDDAPVVPSPTTDTKGIGEKKCRPSFFERSPSFFERKGTKLRSR